MKRGTQVLVADRVDGPFRAFDATRSTLPPDMMTLDGTLWVEDGVPYMVFCHEWVQIKDGTLEYVRLKDDLSATDGEDGGHAMLFRRLDGQLMMILHSPNVTPREHAVLLEMEELDDTLRVKR